MRTTATDGTVRRLQAEEDPAKASGQRSKATSKRARKKAARQQAAASARGAQAAGGVTDAAATSDSAAQGQVVADSFSAPTSGALQTDAAAVPPAAPLAASDSTATADDLPARRPAAAGAVPAADAAVVAGPDWSRCPLSGKVMRDPVLYGSEGHSFEREALERWVVPNPGVDPLTGQPLPPDGDRVLPNHALRNMIQQLHLS